MLSAYNFIYILLPASFLIITLTLAKETETKEIVSRMFELWLTLSQS